MGVCARSGEQMTRRISLVVIIMAVSLGSGHLVQNRAAQEKALHTVAANGSDNG